MARIIANSEEEKKKLIEASEQIHYSNIDTDQPMVNWIAHLYLHPEDIEVCDVLG